jgi:hypothetical protein
MPEVSSLLIVGAKPRQELRPPRRCTRGSISRKEPRTKGASAIPTAYRFFRCSQVWYKPPLMKFSCTSRALSASLTYALFVAVGKDFLMRTSLLTYLRTKRAIFLGRRHWRMTLRPTYALVSKPARSWRSCARA